MGTSSCFLHHREITDEDLFTKTGVDHYRPAFLCPTTPGSLISGNASIRQLLQYVSCSVRISTLNVQPTTFTSTYLNTSCTTCNSYINVSQHFMYNIHQLLQRISTRQVQPATSCTTYNSYFNVSQHFMYNLQQLL